MIRGGRWLVAVPVVVAVAVSGLAGVGPVGLSAGASGMGPGWSLSTSDPLASSYHPAFVANGYVGTRVPASGQGYDVAVVDGGKSLATESPLAGFYAESGGKQLRASLPAWSGLEVLDEGYSFDDALASEPCVFGRECQMEDVSVPGSLTVSSDHRGFHGGGFVSGWGPARAGMTVAVGLTAKVSSAEVVLRYASGDPDGGGPDGLGPRALAVHVAGVQSVVALPSTGSFDVWSEVRVPVPNLSVEDGDGAEVTVSCPAGADCRVNVDSVALLDAGGVPRVGEATLADRGISDYDQTLDFATGTINTSAVWRSPAGRVSRVEYSAFVDQSVDRRAVVSVRVTPEWEGVLEVRDVIDSRAATYVGRADVTQDVSAGLMTSRVVLAGTEDEVGVTSALRGVGVRAAADVSTLPAGSVGQVLKAQVSPGRVFEFAKFVGISSSQDGAAPGTDSQAVAREAAATGVEKIRSSNDARWADRWRGDIVVNGDERLQEQIRASRFYLLSSASETRPWSLSPAGLSSGNYGGHVFWDTETWMWPSLVAQDPEIAREILRYRSLRLEDGRVLASKGGNEGVRFPWEGAGDGREHTPADFSLFGDTEQHITADVALAFWQYYLATGDREWLKNDGWPVIEGAAKFWASRAELGPDGKFHIRGVTPPDEFAGPQDDSAYTNTAAATVLRFASEAAEAVGGVADSRWADIAGAMFVPHDSGLGITPEYQGYAGQDIKQADVVMLTYPWGPLQDPVLTEANLDFYSGRIAGNGPSMTDAIQSVVAADLGLACRAFDFTRESVDPFMRPPFSQFSEEREGGAFTFTTGAGGFLQEFYYGYTGLRFTTSGVRLNPILPTGLDGLTLTGLHSGATSFDVEVGPYDTRVSVTGGPALQVDTPGGAKTVAMGREMTMPTRVASDCPLRPAPPNPDPVPVPSSPASEPIPSPTSNHPSDSDEPGASVVTPGRAIDVRGQRPVDGEKSGPGASTRTNPTRLPEGGKQLPKGEESATPDREAPVDLDKQGGRNKSTAEKNHDTGRDPGEAVNVWQYVGLGALLLVVAGTGAGVLGWYRREFDDAE
jgi:trehalose/maltose hydrolase-like predicted phosphorylase